MSDIKPNQVRGLTADGVLQWTSTSPHHTDDTEWKAKVLADLDRMDERLVAKIKKLDQILMILKCFGLALILPVAFATHFILWFFTH
jgi:hypothetical protein